MLPLTPGTVPHWTDRCSKPALAPLLCDSLVEHPQLHSAARFGGGIDATLAARRSGELDRRSRHGVEEGPRQTGERPETFGPLYEEYEGKTEQERATPEQLTIGRRSSSWCRAALLFFLPGVTA